ncbi:hypothetical protein TrVE_jg14317 [Triparma verrucosa]|uniref:Ubiquitin-like protease family profile domain-containing protein n=1 Tax=Triparma verrucosa TaxID=1606542 RepID=A0A9W7EWQ6_9STRA|nr:hypothetical protein TrVE_jg14317 [Triparma verrucosa]
MRSTSVDSSKQKHRRRGSFGQRRKTDPNRDGSSLSGSLAGSVTDSLQSLSSQTPSNLRINYNNIASSNNNNNYNNYDDNSTIASSSSPYSTPLPSSSIIDLTSPLPSSSPRPSPLNIDPRTFSLILEISQSLLAKSRTGSLRTFEVFKDIINGTRSNEVERSFDRNLNLGSSMTDDLTDTLGKLSFTKNSNNASYADSSSKEWKAFKAKVEGHAVQCQLGVEGSPSIISTSQDLERSLTRLFMLKPVRPGTIWSAKTMAGNGGTVGMGYHEFRRLLEEGTKSTAYSGLYSGSLSTNTQSKFDLVATSSLPPQTPTRSYSSAKNRVDSLDGEISKWKTPAAEKREKARLAKQKLELSGPLKPLSPDDDERVTAALNQGSSSALVAEIEGDSITVTNFLSLRDGSWLSDEVISIYFRLLKCRDVKSVREGKKKLYNHYFKSFFFTKLFEDGSYKYSGVKRWGKKVANGDVFSLEKILIPVNVNNMHWCLLEVSIPEKRIQYYDSLGGSGEQYLKGMLMYLNDEWQKLSKPGDFVPEDWSLISTTKETPRQKNGYDCGVFTCTCADYISLGLELTYTQKDITVCRRRMALKILNGEGGVTLD